MREKLMQILDKPVFPDGKSALEAVADYLLENDVVPVVRCKNCKHCLKFNGSETFCDILWGEVRENGYCYWGEDKNG